MYRSTHVRSDMSAVMRSLLITINTFPHAVCDLSDKWNTATNFIMEANTINLSDLGPYCLQFSPPKYMYISRR